MDYFNKSSKFIDIMNNEYLKVFNDQFFPWENDYEILKDHYLSEAKELLNIDSDFLIETLNVLLNKFIKKEQVIYKVNEYSSFYLLDLYKGKDTFFIVPGGGYEKVCSLNEGFLVAHYLNKLGYNAFILNYRVNKEAHYINPLIDVSDSIKYIINNKDIFNIKTNNYGIIGFSAGGHLVGSLVSEKFRNILNIPKPRLVVLSYPVISLINNPHIGSRDNFLKEDKDNISKQVEFSVNNLVNKSYPNTYIWSLDSDNCVNFSNTLEMVEALKKFDIPYELKVYHGLNHGLGVSINSISDKWIDDMINFYNKLIINVH